MLREKSVLIVDDDPAFRSLIRNVLDDAGYVVCGEAANGAEAIELAHALSPDVITMDLEMPVLDGIAATKQLSKECAAVIVIVSGSRWSDHVDEALAAGARAAVQKQELVTRLPVAIAELLS